MLFVDRDDVGGETIYMVCNDKGLCLIRTTNGAIATFVNDRSKGIDPNLRLTIGGDPGTKKSGPKPVFHHIRKYTR